MGSLSPALCALWKEGIQVSEPHWDTIVALLVGNWGKYEFGCFQGPFLLNPVTKVICPFWLTLMIPTLYTSLNTLCSVLHTLLNTWGSKMRGKSKKSDTWLLNLPLSSSLESWWEETGFLFHLLSEHSIMGFLSNT